ncbi:PTS sugar transporter subunit IIB [Ligilactobacillus animalis]|jgi:PTS system mannose-specific IIB component|uniref:PTS sugar transporter subunit IIB n=1 Tax=Ligilactobacillus animalis TaxID=1605 RepID=UPI002595FB52|nr:PTS sugar transporter subunit IIB [Ligilactobacillus animalis]
MPVIRARIDQRMIHGIVVNQWFAELQPKRYMVVDDIVSQNEGQKAALRLSKPNGTGMSLISVKKAIENFKNGNYDNQKVFLIVRYPEVLLQLLEAGIQIPRVDLGIMFDAPEKTKLSKFISLTSKEQQELEQIQKQGVPVFIKYVPTDAEEVYSSK